MTARISISALVLLLTLSGCSTGSNVSVMDSGEGVLRADEIRAALGGKTFAYTGGGASGTIIYAEDGTSLYTEDGKGNGTGRWSARNGQLCQSLDPTSFLPSGRSESCASFSRSGNSFMAGPMLLTEVAS